MSEPTGHLKEACIALYRTRDTDAATQEAIAHALIALVEEVRGLRADLTERTGSSCPHGTYGLCMACFQNSVMR